MSINKWQSGLFGVIIVLLLLTACGGAEDTSAEPTAPPATEAPAATDTAKPTEPAVTLSGTEEEQPKPTEPPAEPDDEAESEVPFDVPIMEGAQDLLIQKETGSVTYVLEETAIEQVYEFYQSSLTEKGWEARTSSAIGMMATLVYETEEARVSVSLQANEIAKTVTVRLFILAK